MIGEAPSPTSDPSFVFDGRSIRWMRYLTGVSDKEIRRGVRLENLLHRCPGDRFPRRSSAPLALPSLVERVIGAWEYPSCVVCAGRRSAEHLGIERQPFMVWTETNAFAELFGENLPAAIVPHPSGKNRWWNDATNRAEGSLFLRRLFERGLQEMKGVAA
jgi:hypothetical protein